MKAETCDWRSYRSKYELALVDHLESKLRTNLGYSDSQFFFLTLSPDRSESSFLTDHDRQYATPRSSLVHRPRMSRCITLYGRWNKLFFKRPSAIIGNHFPMVLTIDDPIVMSGGVTHDGSNCPHAHIVMAIQAKHVEKWQRMQSTGLLQADTERLFPRGNLDVKTIPEADVPRILSYSLKYHFQVLSNEHLFHFFYETPSA
ncbi:hypothetical protein AB4097_21205 [Microvirga sp. 2MCAF35]|uniref:hypothetical protein n=1 Tax=Microvirga sp. 2MCAF35 TaxID=3232987 RepID=UPI003F99DF1E